MSEFDSSRSSMMLSASVTFNPIVCSASLVCFIDTSMCWFSWLCRNVSSCFSMLMRFLPMLAKVPRRTRLLSNRSLRPALLLLFCVALTLSTMMVSSRFVAFSACTSSPILDDTLISAISMLSRGCVPHTANATPRTVFARTVLIPFEQLSSSTAMTDCRQILISSLMYFRRVSVYQVIIYRFIFL